MGDDPPAPVHDVDLEELLPGLLGHPPDGQEAGHREHDSLHLVAILHRLGDHKHRLLERGGNQGVPDHRRPLEAPVEALLEGVLDDRLRELDPRVRALAVGVGHPHVVEVAVVTQVALEGLLLADMGHPDGEGDGSQVDLHGAGDDRHLRAKAIPVDRDLLGKAAGHVELGGSLVELQALLAVGHEVERRAEQGKHPDQEEEDEERGENPPPAPRRRRSRRRLRLHRPPPPLQPPAARSPSPRRRSLPALSL